jgi:hypothetical protein
MSCKSVRLYGYSDRVPATLTSSRGAISWAPRTIVLIAVAFGIFTMHTLPSMASTPAMAGMGQGPRGNVTPAAKLQRAQPLTVAEPMAGCEGGHSTCSAVLQSPHTLSALSTGGVLDTNADSAGSVLLTATGDGSRAPPQVCLTRLCISRT